MKGIMRGRGGGTLYRTLREHVLKENEGLRTRLGILQDTRRMIEVYMSTRLNEEEPNFPEMDAVLRIIRLLISRKMRALARNNNQLEYFEEDRENSDSSSESRQTEDPE